MTTSAFPSTALTTFDIEFQTFCFYVGSTAAFGCIATARNSLSLTPQSSQDMAGFLARAGPGVQNLMLLLNPTYLLLALFNSTVLWQESVSRTGGKFDTLRKHFLSFSPLDSVDLSHVCCCVCQFFRKTQTERRPAAQIQRWVQKRELCAQHESRRWNGTQFWATWSERGAWKLSDSGVVNLPICQFIVSHQKFNSSLRGEKKLVNIHEVVLSNCANPGWNLSLLVPIGLLASCKSDTFCQGAAAISMKLVQAYRGPWASQRWTAIWRLCRPFCVVFPCISHLSGTVIENHDCMITWAFLWYFLISRQKEDEST